MQNFQQYLINDDKDDYIPVNEETVIEDNESDLESLPYSKNLTKKELDPYKKQSLSVFDIVDEILKNEKDKLTTDVENMKIESISSKEENVRDSRIQTNMVTIKNFISVIEPLSNGNLNKINTNPTVSSSASTSSSNYIKDLQWIENLIDNYNLNVTSKTSVQVIEKLRSIIDSLEQINSSLDSFIIHELTTNGVNHIDAEIYHKNITPYDSPTILLNLNKKKSKRSRRLRQD